MRPLGAVLRPFGYDPAVAGVVYFVGTGPGDPGLLTVRAAEVLPRLEVAIHDAGVHPEVLARLSETCERRACKPSDSPERDIVELARKGKVVGRLMQGDPFLGPSGEREVGEVARARVAFEVVPGMPVLPALGAYAGIPPFRSSDASPSVAMCAVDPGHESLQDWSRLAQATDTLLVLTDAASVPEIARSLIFHERLPTTPAAIVSGLSTPSQRVVACTVQELAARATPLRGRVALVIGDPVSLRDRLAWFDARPLFGKRVAVPRPKGRASGAAELLRQRGAEPVLAPTIAIAPPSDPGPLREAIARLSTWDWVVFTSANGVERTFDEMARLELDARAFGSARVAAIGPATAASLRERGVAADLVAKEPQGEGLASDLLAELKPGAKVLVLRARVAREVLPEALRAAGCAVDVVAAYETHPAPAEDLAPLVARLEKGEIDAVLFTSGSTVTQLCDALGARASELLGRVCVASIGPVTTEAAQARGLQVTVVAATPSLAALVEALEGHFARAFPAKPEQI
jgi:uroporphyrinogen III methyltransferase/synthase